MAGRREWLALALLGLPTFLVTMDFSVLYLAVPHLTIDLAPSGIQQLWIVDIYGLLIASLLVTMGAIGDRIGRKKLLLVGAFSFGAASVAAAFSTSPEMLIASRALLGVAGAAVMPSVLALVTGMFVDDKQRARAIAIYLTCFMAGLTLGPLVGGVLLEYFWWGSVFLLAVPGLVLLLVFGPALLSDQKAPQAGKLDPVSVVLSLAAILPFVYGLKELARHGWEWFPTGALVFGIAAGLVFVRRQGRLEHPLLDLRMFGNRTFSSALTLMFVTSVVGTGTLLLVTLHLQNVTGLTPLEAGLLLVAPNVVMIVGSLGTPSLANHIRPAYLIAGGLSVAGAGYLVFTLADSTSGPRAIVVAMCVAMLGTGPLAAFCNHLAMGAVPPDKAGSGASIVQTTNEFGLGLGIATLATLGTAVYRGQVDGALGSLPPDVAGAARESVDRAVEAADQLPAQQSGDLLAAARDAFASGLHVVGVVSAIFYAGLAVLAVWAFRHLSKSGAGDDDGRTQEMRTVTANMSVSPDGQGARDLEVEGRAILDGNRFMTLGTANTDGEPWASPVFYVADGYSTFYWISSPEATQSRNIAARPRVGIVVFNSQQEPGSGEAVYMAATACELTGRELDRGLEIYLGVAPFSQGPEVFRPPGRYRAYRATVTEHFMRCPQASSQPCPVHGRTSAHRVAVLL